MSWWPENDAWRAAAMAGLREVPCLVAQVGEEDSALLALMENLQRRDLDCWEEAEALVPAHCPLRLSQEEAGPSLGRSQPAVANKLRAAAGCRTPCGSFCRKTA